MARMLESPTIENWTEVLDRLDSTLESSLALNDERPDPLAEHERASEIECPSFRRLDERLAALQSALDQAEANAAEADAVLAAEAERAERCVAALGTVRHKLVDWAARAI